MTGAVILIVIVAVFWLTLLRVLFRANAAGRADIVSVCVLVVTVWCSGWAAWDLVHHDWLSLAVDATLAILYYSWWFRNGGGRDRAGKLIGAKARAVRDKLVRRQREAAAPGRAG